MKGGVRVNNCVPAESVAEGSLNEFAPGNGGDDEDWRDNPYSHIMSYIARHEDWNDRYGEDEVDSTVSDMITMGSLENAEDLEDAVFLVGDVLEKNNPDEAPDWSEGVAEGSTGVFANESLDILKLAGLK